MIRRSQFTTFGIVVAFLVGLLIGNRPAPATADPPAGRGKCCGIATSPWGSSRYMHIYRAFEDGSVERLSDEVLPAEGDGKWHPVRDK
jgi:hypothetical protein